ncbi:phosphotransferase [Achromobacter aloeverae]|uniref:Hydroxylysine kinase n=1 Tax=Achromobacter aloeverae TaxID=1750518 RepID=A0A4Q1HLX0_9BURK|nr:phosphotransferase [Achromobacter aloeverae]RXN90498.1 homoserine kinase [Achromobacter aloeverae]
MSFPFKRSAEPDRVVPACNPGASPGQAVFAAEPPRLALADAESIAWQAYGLRATARLLSSERDQNFLLRLDDGRAYVLKATHPAEDPAVTDFQTQAQLHLMQADAALPIPHLHRTRDGGWVYWYEGPVGVRRAIRLISFVNGMPLWQAERGPAQRAALGQALAAFDLALQGFDHPMAGHELLWDLQRAESVADLLPLIEEPGRRALAESHMARFVENVRPALRRLPRRQVIHNDLNAYNIMVFQDDPARIAALLDFGDMVRAPLVQDLGVAAAYQLEDAADPITPAATTLIAAYHRALPLDEDELVLLPDLIAARLLITVAITGWRAHQHPENSKYILRNNGLAWTGLARLAALAPGQASDIVLEACRGTPA